MASACRMLDLSALPDALYSPDVPAEEWLQRSKPGPFAPGSLGSLTPISRLTEIERLLGIPLYLTLNWLPFLLPLTAWYAGGWTYLLVYVLAALVAVVLGSSSGKRASSESQRRAQYIYTERNNQKYLSMRVVWPKAVESLPTGQPVIFAAIPHGVAPFGITMYPVWSKLFSGVLCHWTTAPIVLKIPLVGWALRRVGYIPAKAKAISRTLTERGESVGVILDGIAGARAR